MSRMQVSFEGRTYQFGPELWADMHLPRDHSSWARSVRWSCGRPGFRMPDLRLFEDGPARAMRADLGYQRFAAAMAMPSAFGTLQFPGIGS